MAVDAVSISNFCDSKHLFRASGNAPDDEFLQCLTFRLSSNPGNYKYYKIDMWGGGQGIGDYRSDGRHQWNLAGISLDYKRSYEIDYVTVDPNVPHTPTGGSFYDELVSRGWLTLPLDSNNSPYTITEEALALMRK